MRQIRNPPDRNHEGNPGGKAGKTNTVAPSGDQKTSTPAPPSGQSKNKTITPPVKQNVSSGSKQKEVKMESKSAPAKTKKEKGNLFR